MSHVVVIPSRYNSKRLPGKPLKLIAGKPMIQHVYDRAMKSDPAFVIIATDDERIVDICRTFVEEECTITRTGEHPSGTDRVAEACRQHRLSKDWIIVNVQGDEPLMSPEAIRECAALMEDDSVDIATLASPIKSIEDFNNPNIVKVVTDYNDNALYFSRAGIPYPRTENPKCVGTLGQHGIYAYRNSVLQKLVNAEQSPLETSEGCEQLRALSLGMTIRVGCPSVEPGPGVDTPEGLAKVRELMEINEL